MKLSFEKNFGIIRLVKKFTVLFFSFGTFSLVYANAILSECRALHFNNGQIKLELIVTKGQDELSTQITTLYRGKKESLNQRILSEDDYPIRNALDELYEDERYLKLNSGEQLLMDTMETTGFYSNGRGVSGQDSGLNLMQVKNVKVYNLGKIRDMGEVKLVEAMDKDGNKLGSFITGFYVHPCY